MCMTFVTMFAARYISFKNGEKVMIQKMLKIMLKIVIQNYGFTLIIHNSSEYFYFLKQENIVA